MLRLRRPLTTLVAAGGLLTLTAAPAAAHPFFADGATIPASSLGSVSLSMAHGCGTEADGGGDPTLEVAVEIPDQVSFVEADDLDGYDLEVEGDGAVPEVLVWTATDGGEPAPTFDLDLVVDGDEGDEVYFRVFQGCDDFQYRWVGTPDEPADDPAVRLTLGAVDPDSPPPEPEPEPEPEVEDEEPVEDPAATDEDDELDGDPEATDVEDLPTEPTGDETDGGLGALPIIIGAIVLAGLGALLVTKRRPAGTPGPGGDAGGPPAP